MRIQNDFELHVTSDAPWQALTGLPRVATRMPGANLTDVYPDGKHRATVGVKLGPLSMNFMGETRIADANRKTGRLVVEGVGSERRGRGRATTRIETQLGEESDKDNVNVNAVIDLSGSVAHYGRRGGIREDVLQEFIGQFVSLREEILHGEPTAARTRASEPTVSSGAKGGAVVQGDRGPTQVSEIGHSTPTGLSSLIPVPHPAPGSTASQAAPNRPAARRLLTESLMSERVRRAGSGASPKFSVLCHRYQGVPVAAETTCWPISRKEKRAAAARRDLMR